MENIQKNQKLCEICDTDAKCLCFKCSSYFCDSCYKFIHDKHKNSNHIKEKIDPFIQIDVKCPDHPKNINNLFCVDEKGKLYFQFIILLFI